MNKMLMAVAVLAVSCGLPGAPVVGSKCDPEIEQPECATETTISYCDGTNGWREFPCDGRCSNAQEPRCTLTRGPDGALCPNYAGAQCDTPTSYSYCHKSQWKFVTCDAGMHCYDNGFISCK